jgi:hypothetical protein
LDNMMSEAALDILAGATARREMSKDKAAPRALVEAVVRHGSVQCQEHTTYLVMALAHGGVPGHGTRARWWPRRTRAHAVDSADWRGAGAPLGLVAREPTGPEQGGQDPVVVQGRRAFKDEGALYPTHRTVVVVPW